ncbi:MAG: hypothetical protein PHQ42_02535 [Patescibacteria group bacterium]|nr:hypothetical protein [Patescibacteria group bacterium]
MTVCIGFLFSPLTAPAGIFGIIGIPIARAIRAVLDSQAEKNEEKERNETEEREGNIMNISSTLPMVRTGISGLFDHDDIFPYSRSYTTPISPFLFSPKPENTIAGLNPDLGASLLRTQSGNSALGNLANSLVATEFAKNGWGTRAGVRTKRGFFGGETTEIFIEPIK